MKVPAEPRPHAEAIVRDLLKRGRILRSTDVKRGMKGYARSVFQGTKIEQFPIVVLGTLERVNGGGDIVLIRVTGGTVIKRQSGIIAGMSGSPVYINGKMLGAIALGWSFPREPIAGVTPITEMIRTSLPDPQNAKPAPTLAMTGDTVFRPRESLQLAGHNIGRVVVSRDRQRVALTGPPQNATATLRPAVTLLQMSGISQASLPRWQKMFEPYGIAPVIGPSSRKTGVKVNVEPGSALGVQLVSGDMDMTAIGTITFRWGNRILGFGHPMLGKGSVSLPMTTAYVHDIFPSFQESFKLGSPIAPLGALQQDNLPAIGGTMGMVADTVPMQVRIVNGERGIDRRFKMQLIKDPVFTPQLVNQLAMDTVMSTLGMDSDKMVRVNFRMDLEGAAPIMRTNYVYAQDYVVFGALGDALQALTLTQGNPYQRGAIKNVTLDVAVEPVRKTARIRRLFADRNSVKAGESFTVTVALEPTGEPDKEFKRTFTFKVPEDAPSGAVRVAVGNGASYWSLGTRVGGAPPQTSNFKELLEAYSRMGPANELLVQTSTPTGFWMIDRKRIDEPPPTWARLVRPEASSAVGIFNEIQMQRETSEYSLSGMQFLALPVESLRRSDRTPPDSATDTTSGAKSGTDVTISGGMMPPNMLLGGSIDISEDDEDAATMPGLGGTRRAAIEGFLNPLGLPAVGNNSAKPLLEQTGMFLKQVGREGQWSRLQTPPAITPIVPIPPAGAAPTATPSPAVAAGADSATKTTDADVNLARPVSHWIQNTAADFARGTFDGAVVTDDGMVQLAPSASLLATTSDPIAWSVAAAPDGSVYIGTGHDARIYRVHAGKVTTFYDGPEIAVTALTTDAAGNVYAGVAPGGHIYRFAPDGRQTRSWDTGQNFVWALAWDGPGRLLAGTGGKQGLLMLAPNTEGDSGDALLVLTRVAQPHVRAIALQGSSIFLGTGGSESVLYRFDKNDSSLKALYQATPASPRPAGDGNQAIRVEDMGGGQMMITVNSRTGMTGDAMMVMGSANDASMYGRGLGRGATGSEILAVAAAPEGIYFGTSLNGGLYRWTAEAGVRTVCNTAGQSIYALQRSAAGKLYAATGDGGYVYEIRPGADGTPTRLARLLDAPQTQALALAISPAGDLVIGTANNAAAYTVPLNGATTGTFTSNVLDTRGRVAWGALRLNGSGGVAISTRSGDVLEPDASWSTWAPTTANELGELRVASPPARYLQYRAKFTRADTAAALPTLSRLDVVFRPRNQAPTVAMSAPAGGEYWRGKKSLTWTAQDPDKDALRYRAWLSGDAGVTWKSVEIKTPTSASVEIDTTKFADGTYRARVEASDAARNPEDPQTATSTGDPFVIDNSAPMAPAAPPIVRGTDGDKTTWRITVAASDALSPLAGAEWRLAPLPAVVVSPETKAVKDPKKPEPVKPGKPAPVKKPEPAKVEAVKAVAAKADKDEDGDDDALAAITGKKTDEKTAEWAAAAAVDGIFDSRNEQIVVLILSDETRPEIKAGARIEIRVRDAAGNSTTVTAILS